jgi:hypothetical protein
MQAMFQVCQSRRESRWIVTLGTIIYGAYVDKEQALLDALIVRTVPGVRKTVKWNSPFYGVEGQGWFFGIHCFAKYVKVAFFRGASLRPIPPGESKQKEVRYLDIHEDDELDEAQLAAWVKQASILPGKQM